MIKDGRVLYNKVEHGNIALRAVKLLGKAVWYKNLTITIITSQSWLLPYFTNKVSRS